jgi:acetoin:2,6-dichlorophenolindophenol oxidoreductase subunit beta
MSSQTVDLNKANDRVLTFRQAISEALYQEMERDDRVFLMGEDLRVFYGGGPFAVTPKEKFLDKFGPERVRDTPISEAGYIGAAVMAAVGGSRPIVELMFSDFLGVCFDQIANQGAKLRYMFGGQSSVPLVIRTNIGGGMSFGATHSQSPYSVFAHFPGIKVVVPSTPYDAKGLLISSIRDNNIVAFFEHKLLYGVKGGKVPKEEYEIPLGKADVKREGSDVTIVALGLMLHKSLEAAEELSKEGINCEVVDPRTIVPLDTEAIVNSVKKTSRLVIVDEDYLRCGFSAEVAAIASDEAFGFLDAPIKRVANPNVPIPYAKHLEDEVIPNVHRITDAVKQICRS